MIEREGEGGRQAWADRQVESRTDPALQGPGGEDGSYEAP